jgi:hypothetical protein
MLRQSDHARYVSKSTTEYLAVTRLSFMPLLVCSAMLLSCLSHNNESIAQPVVLESAVMGTPGRIGGTSITTSQFVGWRFETSQTLDVERIGGHLLSFPDETGDIFAALVRLQSISSVPMGAPFTPEEVVATTTFRPPFPSAEVYTPLSATLTPGSYALVFGTGLFGGTGAGALHNGDDQPDVPPTNLSSFIFWSIPFVGQPPEWRLNLASHMRFVIEAQVVIPGDFNHDDVVNAADYVVWRKIDSGNSQGYTDWRENFGDGLGASGGSQSASPPEAGAPESSTLMMLIVAAVGVRLRLRNAAIVTLHSKHH